MTAAARGHLGAERNDRGELVRQGSRFLCRVSADGSAGLRAEPGRYHLYVSLACPWARLTIIVRRLKAPRGGGLD